MAVQFYITTLGCKVNQYESHSLLEAWQRHGWQAVSDPALAALIVVNSCAVTARAVADVRSTVRRLRREAPDAAIWLTGCAAEAAREELKDLAEADAVLGQDWKEALLRLPSVEVPKNGMQATFMDVCGEPTRGTPPGGQLRKGMFQSREETPSPRILLQHLQPADERPGLPFPDFRISGYDRSRPVLKVQDGCSHRCTYCIVPLTRGPSRSRPAEASLAEIRRLLDAGFREITLSGINLRQYRHRLKQGPEHVDMAQESAADAQRADRNAREAGIANIRAMVTGDADVGAKLAHTSAATMKGADFWALVEFLEKELAPEWAGTARFRISSLEPGQLDARALDVLGTSRLVAPQMHLSLQSGSPSVLQRMGRGHYNPATIADFLQALGKHRPIFGLGADILTGFPGETEAEFQETLDLCRRLSFSYAHVFPYSIRPGTKAANMPGQLPQAVKKERAALLRQVIQEKQQAFLRRIAAETVLHVVFEDRHYPFLQEGTGMAGKTAFAATDGGVEGTTGENTPSAEGGVFASAAGNSLPPVQQTPGSKHRSDADGRLRGVCEYYADCILVDGGEHIHSRSITPVSVIGLERGLLLVRP